MSLPIAGTFFEHGTPCKSLHTLLLALVISFVSFHLSFAGINQSQTITLNPGWNAIYLEIDPDVTDPNVLFAGQPVDIVASFDSPKKGAQFVRNPSAGMLGSYGWAVWYASSRPDTFLTSLYGIYGAKPYLIHARTNATIAISGSAAPVRMEWTPNSYNFVGFAVTSPGGPTFKQFFKGSTAHNHNRIYRMVDGTWRQILNPTNAVMKSGEAFWIYCSGRSDYPGPLEASSGSRLGLNLSSQAGGQLVFRNRTTHPISFVLEHITDPALPIPISTPVLTMDEETGGLRTLSVHFDASHFQQTFPALEAGKAIRLPLALRLQDAGPGERHSLMKVTSDLGTIIYIPVTALRDDL